MNDPARKARWMYLASTLLFILFCVLSSGGPFRLWSGPAAEVASGVGTLAGIFAWTLMCCAYGAERNRAAKQGS